VAGAFKRARLVKELRTYTVAEIAEVLGVHRNTVRHWLKTGLTALADGRPTLVRGAELKRFLAAKRSRRKRPCGPGTIYCMKCREPRRPGGDMAEYHALSATSGDLVGICPDCSSMMYRRVSLSALPQISAGLDVTATQDESRLGERP